MAVLTFTNPSFLWFLLSIPLLVTIHFLALRQKSANSLKFSNFPAVKKVASERAGIPFIGVLRNKDFTVLIIRAFSLGALVLAVSGTVLWYSGLSSEQSFVLAIDASTSMLADDFNPNRLEAAKQSATLFINDLPFGARVGVVSFSGVSYIESGVTQDKDAVKAAVRNIDVKPVGGTDLGNAIITSSNLLIPENSSRVIVLLTDGQSNIGISLAEAINYASYNNITVHTIGMGTEQGGNVSGIFTSKLDKKSLQEIADSTNGQFFVASSEQELERAYNQIAVLKYATVRFDISNILLVIGITLLLVEWWMLNTIYRTIP